MPPQQYHVPAAMASQQPQRAAPQAAPPSRPALAQQPPPRPIVRAQAPDEPAHVEVQPTKLAIPSPEQLGVTCAKTGEALDWNAAHARLDRLGATCLHEEKLSDGSCRATCLLSTDRPGCSHRVEAQANSSADAFRVMLDEAEKWAAKKQ
ncbi:MAG: hypothetical protein K2R98_24025 [Gemmataceae bacterium]|nr:hypothetical protein [Gemmataceae bacterium]